MERYKYPRTFHLKSSPGLKNDDRQHKDETFFIGKEVVITLKMDGENTSIYPDGTYHARSLDTPYHPSRTWVGRLAGEIGWQLPEGWRVTGENIYAEHSIHYDNLDSYFQVFAIWNEKNECLSWDETEEWCALLGLNTVPVVYRGTFGHNHIYELIERIQNEPETLHPDPIEGFVVRIADKFSYPDDPKGNDETFMQELAKWVRKDHVQTDEHWLEKPVVPNGLKKEETV